MTTVNHLRDIESQKLFHAVAYGKHMVTGHLAKSSVTGSDPTHVITLQQTLGRGEWDGCEGLWWNGTEVKSDKYKFHPGKQTPRVLKNYTVDHTTDTFTSAAHGYNNGDMVIFLSGDIPPEITAGTIYFIVNKTTNTFQVSLTSGGSAVALTANGSGTRQIYKNDFYQGVDTVFNTDVPHSGVAWIRAELGVGFGEFDTKTTPPEGLKGIFRTTKCYDYDTDGSVTDYLYSTNPALQVADLIVRIGGIPATRIDWISWYAWRTFLAANISYDYTALTDFDGFGLTTSLYNGVAFDTLVSTRVDPVIEFVSSAGSPGVGVDVDNFSVRFEGKIKPKYPGEDYTFYVTHTHGAKLWVNGTLLVDQWTTTGTHSDVITLSGTGFFDIKLEWKHTTGNAEIRLEWESASQAREVVSHRALYPKTASRPRYETHPFFAGPTRLDDAVRTILNLCNSTVQEVDGKLQFFCLEQLTTTGFDFTDDNTVDGSMQLVPRDLRTLRNTWQARFRDIDSQYLEYPIDPILIERPTLITAAGRKIDGDAIELFNCTMHQGYRTLDNIVRRNSDSRFQISMTGTADTFPVLAGDRVAVDVEFRDLTAVDCLVLESNDSSSEDTADERTFTVQEWPDFVVYT